MKQDIGPSGHAEVVFEPDLAFLSLSLSLRRLLSSLGLDFHFYGVETVGEDVEKRVLSVGWSD